MTSSTSLRIRRMLMVSVFAGAFIAGLSADTRAQGAPDTLTFQGLLTNPSGVPLDTTVAMSFKLYKNGSDVWTETHASVTATNGIFNVLLGSLARLDTLDFDQPMDLGVTVGFDSEIVPRIPLGASAFTLAARGMHADWISTPAGTRSYNRTGGAPNNTISGIAIGSTIGGGGGHNLNVPVPNTITDVFSTIGGGSSNSITGAYGTIGGGYSNTAGGNESTVAGGSENSAPNLRSTVGGGSSNLATGEGATVSGGYDNETNGSNATVGGGTENNAGAGSATVSGGNENSATGFAATIGGGSQSQAGGDNSTVGGGSGNLADGQYATVGGGFFNQATANDATISGGSDNIASGVGGMVPGGWNNEATGRLSFAAGRNAKANHGGTFVWADSTAGEFASSGGNQFLIRAAGGVGINRAPEPGDAIIVGTSTSNGNGAHLTNTGTWTSSSSKTFKNGFTPIDKVGLLEKLDALQVTKWQYNGEDGVSHIGPMAEDFRDAFGLGQDRRYITMVDADGVALAAIQGLYEIVKRQQEEIEALRKPPVKTWQPADER